MLYVSKSIFKMNHLNKHTCFHFFSWDFIMQIFLVVTITCWVIAFLRYGVNQTQRNVPRKEWHAFEPILIAESALVFATFMAFTKILFLFQLHPVLGPLQVFVYSFEKFCIFAPLILIFESSNIIIFF